MDVNKKDLAIIAHIYEYCAEVEMEHQGDAKYCRSRLREH